MEERDDTALVALARGGDHQAFGVLFARHRPVLFALCRRALGDALLAEDAVQEATLQAFLDLDRLHEPTKFGSWLHGIGLNMCRRMMRTRSSDVWSWEAIVGGSTVDEPFTFEPGPSEQAEIEDMRSRILRAVHALPDGQRAAVMLFYLSGMSHAEAALMLGTTPGSIKTRLHKARASLQRSLWTVWKEETMEEETDMIEMQVADVWYVPRQDDKPRLTLVALKELDNPRHLVIWIGVHEGEALAVTLQKKETSRPMTYAFAANIMQAAGGHLREVRLTKNIGGIYYAEVIIEGPNGVHSADARPSDALNLALLVGAPIRVSSQMIFETGKWFDGMRRAHETGNISAFNPGLDVLDQIDRMVAGEATGGAAAIVEQLNLP